MDEININMEINKDSSLVVYENDNLALELKKFKTIVRKLNTKKNTYLKMIDDFNDRYTSEFRLLLDEIFILRVKNYKKKYLSLKDYHNELIILFNEKKSFLQNLREESLPDNEIKIYQLQDILKNIKSTIEHLNIKTIKNNYEEALFDYKEYKKTYCKDKPLKKTILKDDEKELKNIYKKASKLCHPDMVDELKLEDAQEFFKELNMAYKNKDLNLVREIFTFLDSGNIFHKGSLQTNDSKKLAKDIEKIKILHDNLLLEINKIRYEEEFSFIFEIKDMDEYFADIKRKLDLELIDLKNTKNTDKLNKEEWFVKLIKWANKYKISEDILPRDIQKLKNIKKLNLSKLELDTLCSELSNLTSLEELNLSNNILTGLPKNLALMKNLKKLNLSYNELSTLENNFQDFTMLEDLNLSYNNFSEIPNVIVKFSSLLSIDFSSNKIEKFNNQENNLPLSLEKLLFAKNNLKDFPDEICFLSRLKILDFGGNFIKILPQKLNNLQNLESLSLWGNNLEMLNDSICDLKNLQNLNLGSNKLTTLPNKISNLTKVTDLELFMNNKLVLNAEQREWEESINPSLF